jgi:hypothetical protein
MFVVAPSVKKKKKKENKKGWGKTNLFDGAVSAVSTALLSADGPYTRAGRVAYMLVAGFTPAVVGPSQFSADVGYICTGLYAVACELRSSHDLLTPRPSRISLLTILANSFASNDRVYVRKYFLNHGRLEAISKGSPIANMRF